jgi:hypothetical protein
MNAYSLSSQQLRSKRRLTRLPGEFTRDGLLAGLVGGIPMTASGMLLAHSAGYDLWLPLKALGSLILGPGAVSAAGFAAGAVFAGLLIQLVAAALLGALFTTITRRVWGLPSDFGVPAVSGLVFGLTLWLAVFLAVPAVLPQLAAIAAPFFVIDYVVYGVLMSLIFARLQPWPYTTTGQ